MPRPEHGGEREDQQDVGDRGEDVVDPLEQVADLAAEEARQRAQHGADQGREQRGRDADEDRDLRSPSSPWRAHRGRGGRRRTAASAPAALRPSCTSWRRARPIPCSAARAGRPRRCRHRALSARRWRRVSTAVGAGRRSRRRVRHADLASASRSATRPLAVPRAATRRARRSRARPCRPCRWRSAWRGAPHARRRRGLGPRVDLRRVDDRLMRPDGALRLGRCAAPRGAFATWGGPASLTSAPPADRRACRGCRSRRLTTIVITAR